MDLGDDYDLVFTVCGSSALAQWLGVDRALAGRTTTLGLHTAEDWSLIELEEQIQLDWQIAASARNIPVYRKRNRGLASFVNYQAMREAGATGTA